MGDREERTYTKQQIETLLESILDEYSDLCLRSTDDNSSSYFHGAASYYDMILEDFYKLDKIKL